MYDQPKKQALISEHEAVAKDMANAICNFSPENQNEMVRIIRQIVSERRQISLDEAEKQLSYLRETFNAL